MKQNWERTTANFHLNVDDAQNIITKHFDEDAKVKDVVLMSGGLSNSNYLIRLADNDTADKIVLRCFTDKSKSITEVELYHRLSHIIPTPTIYGHDDTHEIVTANYILMEFIEGVPLVQILELLNSPGINREGLSKVYYEIGSIMAKIHAMTFDSHGLFSQNLELGELFTINPLFIKSLLEEMLTDLKDSIPPLLKTHLSKYIKSLIPLLGELDDITYFQTPRLIHGDFNEMNIFISEKNRGLRLCIIDWEYAMSGHPFFDLGNITRHLRQDQNLQLEKIAEGYEVNGSKLPVNWYRIAKGFDLVALLQFLARPSLGSKARSDIIRLLDQY